MSDPVFVCVRTVSPGVFRVLLEGPNAVTPPSEELRFLAPEHTEPLILTAQDELDDRLTPVTQAMVTELRGSKWPPPLIVVHPTVMEVRCGHFPRTFRGLMEKVVASLGYTVLR